VCLVLLFPHRRQFASLKWRGIDRDRTAKPIISRINGVLSRSGHSSVHGSNTLSVLS